jgi:hypothetical protein
MAGGEVPGDVFRGGLSRARNARSWVGGSGASNDLRAVIHALPLLVDETWRCTQKGVDVVPKMVY